MENAIAKISPNREQKPYSGPILTRKPKSISIREIRACVPYISLTNN